MATYLWQEVNGEPYYRIQTDEPEIAAKLKRRKDFKQCSWGSNCLHWIFVARYTRPSKARKALGILTGRPVKKDTEEGVYCS